MPLQRRVPKRGFKNRIRWNTLPEPGSDPGNGDKYGMTGLIRRSLMTNGVIGRNDKLKVLGRGAESKSGHSCTCLQQNP